MAVKSVSVLQSKQGDKKDKGQSDVNRFILGNLGGGSQQSKKHAL